MSGICAVVELDAPPGLIDVADRMSRAAPHRGEGRASASSDGCAVLMAQARWRPAAAPGAPVDRSGVLVAVDARLDNAAELRAALRRAGHLAGDETVEGLVAACYLAWGERCAERLIGDFAVVVWDPRRRRAVAARDPLGMRSLFYRVDRSGRRLLLATEVKQVLAAPDVPRNVHEASVAADLLADFGAPGWSFYDGVRAVEPGSVLVVDADGARTRSAWKLDAEHRVPVRSEAEAAEHVRRVFAEAVACRLDPDRPTGVLLSGGVDSGSVASTAGWLLERGSARTPALRAFSWAFAELVECDERHVSRHVVERYGLQATDVPADDGGPLACWPEHLPDADDPFLGAFQPLIEHSLAAARDDGVGVLLGGDRGDLVVGDTGSSYLRMLLAGQYGPLRRELAEHRSALDDPWSMIVRRHLVDAVAGRVRRRTPVEWLGWTADRARRRGPAGLAPPPWVAPHLVEALAASAEPDDADLQARLGPTRALRHRAVFTRLHLRGIAWSERTYARYGLAFADPFSDRRLVELLLALPAAVVNRPGDQSKPLMRLAMRGVMPEPARQQADKVLPTPLYERGLQRRAGLIRQLLEAPLVEERGWVDAAELRRHWEASRGGATLRAEFWWTLQLEVWLRAHWSH